MNMDRSLYSYHKQYETMWKPKELNEVLQMKWIQVVERVEGGVTNLFRFMKPSPFLFMKGEIISIPTKYYTVK